VAWRILGGKVFLSASGSELDFTVTVEGRPLTQGEVQSVVESIRLESGGAAVVVSVRRAEAHSVIRAFISNARRYGAFPLEMPCPN
jgi:hypothetical protein